MGRRAGPMRPLDGGWGWMTVLGCGLAHFLLTGLARAFGVFYVALLDRFLASEGATAFIPCLFNMLRMGFGPVASVLSERFTSRRVVIAGGLIICVGCVISAFATSVLYMYLSFGFMAGIGSGLVFTPSLIVVSQYFDKRKGKAMGFSTLGNGLGAFILAPLFTTLLQQYAYPGAMLILGAMLLNCCVAGALYRPLKDNFTKPPLLQEVEMKEVPDADKNVLSNVKLSPTSNKEGTLAKLADSNEINYTRTEVKQLSPLSSQTCNEIPKIEQTSTEEQSTAEEMVAKKETAAPAVTQNETNVSGRYKISNSQSQQTKSDKIKAYFSILKHPIFFCYGLVIFSMPVCNASYLMLLPALGKSRGYSKTESALLVSMAGISDVIGRFLAGFFFDLRMVRRHRLHYHVVFALMPGIVACVTPLMPTYVTLSCAICAYAFLFSAFNGQRMTVLTDFLPRSLVAYSVGWIHLFQGIGNAGPVVAGYLKDVYGSYTVSYLFCGGAVVLFSSMYWTVLIIYDLVLFKKSKSVLVSENV